MTQRPFVRQKVVGAELTQTPDHVHLRFETPRLVLSSAVLNGGFCRADHYLNMRVPKQAAASLEDPAETLARYCQQQGWQGRAVGMMTAASMKSLRVCREQCEGEELAVLVTTGLANARCAGDPADSPALSAAPITAGTINTVIITSAELTCEAQVELVTLATEAKAAVLQSRAVRSPVSGNIATGTGTDAIAVVSGYGSRRIRYAGKHTLIGERLATLVMAAIDSSLDYQPESGYPESHRDTEQRRDIT